MDSGKFTYVSETRAKGRAEGRAEEAAKNILIVLKARGIPVDDHSRRRIEACTDQEALEKWVSRAAVINKIEELFEG
jgi:hypothetical protein